MLAEIAIVITDLHKAVLDDVGHKHVIFVRLSTLIVSENWKCYIGNEEKFNFVMRLVKKCLYSQRKYEFTMNIGDKAPEILGKDEQGRDIRMSDYKGRKLVLYFYPKDNTSGCTAEACSLRDNYGELQGKGYEVVGVSKDSAASHVKFKEKYELPFPLITDINHELMETMGAWGEKSMYGKKTMGTIRTTFIINEEGIIEQIFAGKQVKTKEHAEQILSL